jgi:hypothetical protein
MSLCRSAKEKLDFVAGHIHLIVGNVSFYTGNHANFLKASLIFLAEKHKE